MRTADAANRSGVLFVGHEATRSGAPIALLHFLRWYKQNGGRPLRILLGEDGDLRGEFAELAEVWSREQGPWTRLALKRRAIGAAGLRGVGARLEQADVRRWVGREPPALIYVNSAASASAAELLPPGIPVLTHVHELEFSFRIMAGKALDGLLSRTKQFIACSNAVRENLAAHGAAPERIETIYESIPVSGVRAKRRREDVLRELRIPDGASVVIGCGTVSWRKGADLFVQLARTVSRLRSDTYFLWVGGGIMPWDEPQFAHDVHFAGLAERIRFTGGVADPADYLGAGDVFALTSREDPYPLVCLEAAALGKPIVCFANAGGIPEFVEQDCGFIVPYMDVAAMAQRVLCLLDSPEARRRMGQAAREKVAARHDVDKTAPRIVEIMERTVAAGAGTAA